jgi:hypothetical protein
MGDPFKDIGAFVAHHRQHQCLFVADGHGKPACLFILHAAQEGALS